MPQCRLFRFCMSFLTKAHAARASKGFPRTYCGELALSAEETRSGFENPERLGFRCFSAKAHAAHETKRAAGPECSKLAVSEEETRHFPYASVLSANGFHHESAFHHVRTKNQTCFFLTRSHSTAQPGAGGTCFWVPLPQIAFETPVIHTVRYRNVACGRS